MDLVLFVVGLVVLASGGVGLGLGATRRAVCTAGVAAVAGFAAGVSGVVVHETTRAGQLAAQLEARYGVTPTGAVFVGQPGPVTLRLRDGSRAACRVTGTETDPLAVCAGGELPRIGP